MILYVLVFQGNYAAIKPFGSLPVEVSYILEAGILRLRTAMEIWAWLRTDFQKRLERLEHSLVPGCLEEFTRMKYNDIFQVLGLSTECIAGEKPALPQSRPWHKPPG